MKIRVLVTVLLSAALFLLTTGIAEASPKWLNLFRPSW